MRLLLLPLVLGMSGCLDAFLEPTTTPVATDCRHGPGVWFFNATHHPGYTSIEWQHMRFVLDRDGVLTYFRGHDTPGTGKTKLNAGAQLKNVTLAQVESVAKQIGVWKRDQDLNVSVAWRDRITPARFDSLCAAVGREFYSYEPQYTQDPSCKDSRQCVHVADCDGFTILASTSRGLHRSYAYCNYGPQGVRKAFDAVEKASRDKLGAAQ